MTTQRTTRFEGPRCVPTAIMLVLLASCSPSQDAKQPPTGSAPSSQVAKPARHVGAQVCAECHAKQAALWRTSHHQLAMQRADTSAVLAPFDRTSFTYHGITSAFFSRDGKPIVRADGPDGVLRDYPVLYTFGVEPLQQYLLPLPGGRLQALSIAWDTRPKAAGGRRWFHLYQPERVDHRDVLHWTGPAQNWNHMCAECHSTDVRKNYSVERDAFDTTWSEINVSCEACHGPGSAHVDWARRSDRARTTDSAKGLVFALAGASRGQWQFVPNGSIAVAARRPGRSEVETCGRCHSRRGQVWPAPEFGKPLADTHRVSLLDEGLYEADGQQLDEVYEYGSFLQSKMYGAGVTCSNCHDPHSGKLVATGNAVCARCHVPSAYDTPTHHFHKAGSPGASCAACHMPARNYMVVDARRDHSFGIPRPDLSQALRIPNACTACHDRRPDSWAAAVIARRHARAAARPSYAHVLAAGRNKDTGANQLLTTLIVDGTAPAITRATAVTLLAGAATPAMTRAIEAAARDADPLVRRAAAERVDILDPESRLRLATALLRDPVRTVRLEAVPGVASLSEGMPAEARRALEAAIAEYRRAAEFNSDRADATVNLAGLEAQLGRPAEAERLYRRALRLQPQYAPAYVNLADLLRTQHREAEADRTLREGLGRLPDVAELHYSLGLSLVRQRRLAEALDALGRAAAMAPHVARFSYVFTVALHDAGRRAEAREVLERAQQRHPTDRDLLLALLNYAAEAGDAAAVRRWARTLQATAPDDTALTARLKEIERRLAAP